MSAIRLARAATGREKLLKFAGAYHGHVDGLLAEAGSGLATGAIPASPGVPQAATADDRDRALERPRGRRCAATEEHEFAAILAEPFAANMGLVPPGRAASSSCCASARAPPARCSSSTRSSPASASPAAAPRSSPASCPT